MKYCVFELIPSIGDGGAEVIVKDYCLHIDRELVKLVVVTITPPNKQSACYREIESSGVEMISIYDKSYLFGWDFANRIWSKTFHTLYVARGLTRLVSKYRPVAIHAHLSVLRYLKAAGKSLNGIRLFATCHSEFDHNFIIPGELNAAHYLARNKKIQFIALHSKMREEINQRLNCDNTVIVNNAIDFKRFINFSTKEKVRASIGVPQDAFVVGHVGRFNDVKNHTFLVDIFAELKKERANAFLLMIGNGVNKQAIIEKLEHLNLSASSLVLSDRTDVHVLLKAMDVFVFPSLFEGLPVSLVEAQVAGLRAVVSETITPECFLSENIISLSLSDPVKKWVHYILDDSIKSSYQRDIRDFDINTEIHQLEKLYLGIES